MSSPNAILDSRRAAATAAVASRAARPAKRDWDAGSKVTPIALRAPNEIAAIRRAGAVVHEALERAIDACVPGATTAEINAIAMEVIANAKATPLFLGYPSSDAGTSPFPACCCISVNDEIVHGVPGARRLCDGDIVSIDCGVRLPDMDGAPAGWCADAAVTVPVGRVAPAAIALIECAREMLAVSVAMARPGERWSEIAAAMQALASDGGFGIVAEYVGHGIGRELHESPHVPNCLSSDLLAHGDFTLRPGMVLAIEPIITATASETDASGFPCGVPTRRAADGWTVVTADGAVAAHVEHTIAITRHGCEVLTLGRGHTLSTRSAIRR